MQIKKTFIAIIIFCLLLLYIKYDINRKNSSPEKRDYVFTINGNIKYLSFQSIHEERFEFEKRDGVWFMKSPESFKCSQDILKGICDSIKELEYTQNMELKKEEYKDFALDNPVLKVEFSDAENKHSIILGDKTFKGNEFFALNEKGEGYVILSAFEKNFKPEARFFKDKTIFSFQENEVDKISLKGMDKEFKAEKKNKGFEFSLKKGNENLTVNENNAETLIKELISLSADKWADLKMENMEDFNFNVLWYTLKVNSGDKDFTVLISRKDDVYYGRMKDSREVFEVSSYITHLIDNLEEETEDTEEPEEEEELEEEKGN